MDYDHTKLRWASGYELCSEEVYLYSVMQCCASNIYLDADFVFWMVLEKIALLMVMVGLKMFMAGTPGLDTIMDWFPATVNSSASKSYVRSKSEGS